MHDIAELESRGVPSVFVATEAFEDAAASQGRAIGFVSASVLVPHPVQDRTDAELAAYADAAVDRLLAALTRGGDRAG